MGEELLSNSNLKLYGQVVTDMTYMHAEKEGDPNRLFARIFGFSYEDGYYDMGSPIVMLVDGPGEAIGKTSPPVDVTNAFTADFKVWTYNKSDSSLRLDAMIGTFEEILLDVELGGGIGSVSSGKDD